MEALKCLLDKNLAWATKIKEEDPEFFSRLYKHQSPKYLWIGCSDGRVPANHITDLPPGDIFEHRNVANMVVHTDLNCLSVIHFAVEVLKIKHLIVCGHFGCLGIKAAMEGHDNGFVDNWLCHIKDVYRFNADKLEGLDGDKKFDLLCELNVIEQVKNLGHTTIVQRAWENNSTLSIHGLIYNVKNGILKDLDVCVTSKADLEGLGCNTTSR